MFAVSHGFYVDREGNVWGGDQIARNGKGADLIKFAPDGKVLMILGKPGMPGNGPGYLTTGSAVVVAPNGDIYVADMRTSGWRSPHRATTNGTMHRTGSSPTTLRDVTAHPLTIAGLQNSGGAP
jgi:hypothetical protein